jgi:predicted RNase H-like nuclease (RuvC/YqgF family)
MPAYNTIFKELRESKRKVDSLSGELESEKARRRALYIELTELLEQLRIEFGIEEVLVTAVSEHGELNRRTPECNLMISVGKTVYRCRQAKLTAQAARQVAIMEVSNLAIENTA